MYGIFLVWRLARAWDLDEEKILDLTLLTLIGGFVGARIYFVIGHLQDFVSSPLNIILINKMPGFDFWGGFLGGWLMLFIFARRFRLDFWQLADITSVGFLGGLILSNVGFYLEKRGPAQLIEALLLAFVLGRIWSQATHFHQRGKIVSQAFIYIGMIGLIFEPFKQNHPSFIFSLTLTLLGLTIFYKITGQNPITQVKQSARLLISFLIDRQQRKKAVQSLNKSWYNQKAQIAWQFRNLKKLLRRSNVKFS